MPSKHVSQKQNNKSSLTKTDIKWFLKLVASIFVFPLDEITNILNKITNNVIIFFGILCIAGVFGIVAYTIVLAIDIKNIFYFFFLAFVVIVAIVIIILSKSKRIN